METPLISCIMPCSRPGDLPRAIEVFLSQDYPNKELNILSDTDGDTFYTNPGNRIWHWGKSGLTIGEKRNHLITYAKGEIICHFDSDDFYAHDYLSRSLSHLINSGADCTGLSSAYFYHPPGDLRLYEYKGQQPYIIGSGMMYHRRVWDRNKFRPVSSGEDAHFCANAGIIKPHNYLDSFIAMIHGNNTASHKQFNTMRAVDPEIAKQILGDDWGKY